MLSSHCELNLMELLALKQLGLVPIEIPAILTSKAK